MQPDEGKKRVASRLYKKIVDFYKCIYILDDFGRRISPSVIQFFFFHKETILSKLKAQPNGKKAVGPRYTKKSFIEKHQ